jgi:hypothetical protein
MHASWLLLHGPFFLLSWDLPLSSTCGARRLLSSTGYWETYGMSAQVCEWHSQKPFDDFSPGGGAQIRGLYVAGLCVRLLCNCFLFFACVRPRWGYKPCLLFSFQSTLWSELKIVPSGHPKKINSRIPHPDICHITRSVVSIATGYGLDQRGNGVRVPGGPRFLSFPRRPDRFWYPSSLLSNGYRGFFPRI